MKEQKIIISVWNTESISELTAEDAKLLNEALKATETAYSPYSNFNVGAAVLLENGVIIRGSNQENTAFPSGLCAERVALFYANAQYPDTKIKAIAITSAINGKQNSDTVYPCGGCRQTMIQCEMRQNKDVRIIMSGNNSIQIVDSAKSLLPLSFNLDDFK